MCPSLPGIVQLAYIPCSQLPPYIVGRALSGIAVSVDGTSLTAIVLADKAVCEVDSDFDNNSRTEKCKLTFKTVAPLPIEQHLAFFIETVKGDKYILGTREKPYPVAKAEQNTGLPGGDASVCKYEVSFTAKKALARCTN